MKDWMELRWVVVKDRAATNPRVKGDGLLHNRCDLEIPFGRHGWELCGGGGGLV